MPRQLLTTLVLSSALYALPAAAQTLPPQPSSTAADAGSAFAQAQADWLTECTWNQSRGQHSRGEARAYCEAYLANRMPPLAAYQPDMVYVPMAAPASAIVMSGGESSYSAPVTAAKRMYRRSGKGPAWSAWWDRCSTMPRF